MRRIVIFGNSGAGKSTLAKSYVTKLSCSHLDLDNLAWLDTIPPRRKPIEQSASQIKAFTDAHTNWIIEGCYTDLLALIIDTATEIIFLNPGTEICVKNCRSRPWEPHKYETPLQQNDNLQRLIDWVRNYSLREDEFSLKSHSTLFENFEGNKTEYNLFENYSE